ncbi:MAG TPA: 50S ribosomal protein L31 [Planctomycetota bacterium]|nr:50S ribosomal protein L31 [Planctomycetota bacterium]
MKEGLHPKYKPVTITCVGCGTKIETRSTRGKDFSIDVCSHCHPFYTGRQKFVDSAGRVERFQKKWAAKEANLKNIADKKAAKEAAAAAPAPVVVAPTPVVSAPAPGAAAPAPAPEAEAAAVAK